jgi:hypothetical protein
MAAVEMRLKSSQWPRLSEKKLGMRDQESRRQVVAIECEIHEVRAAERECFKAVPQKMHYDWLVGCPQDLSPLEVLFALFGVFVGFASPAYQISTCPSESLRD